MPIGGVDTEARPLEEYVRCCTSKGTSLIRDRKLARRAKVFSVRGDCFHGAPGDYLAAGVSETHDVGWIEHERNMENKTANGPL